MKRKLVVLTKATLAMALMVLTVLGTVGSAQAALVNNGGGLIYDTDLNITWYAVAHNTAETWANANAWAAGLTAGGVSGWRLPTTPGTAGVGVNTYEGEMGHLFHTELLNNSGTPNPVNKGPFTTLAGNAYWTGTLGPGSLYAYGYNFGNGTQTAGFLSLGTNISYFSLAVHNGNVGAAVPEPATMLLFGFGLVGLAGLRRFKK